MATTETKQIDSIIASRRAVLMGGGALAAMAVAGTGIAHAAIPATLGDNDILNFALNLEYLEAQFYTLATEGVTADKSTATTLDPNATNSTVLQPNPIAIASTATPVVAGGSVVVKANPKVPFAIPAIKAYAFETAREERNHVLFLQKALQANYVAQPNIDLLNSFNALGKALGLSSFDPFASDANFLLGAFIFEDVGVTAYHGGAAYVSKATLTPAVGIHAVEAYHAGLVRFSLYGMDLQNGYAAGTGPMAKTATAIANFRANLDGTYGTLPTDAVGLTGQDDFGLLSISVPLNGNTQTATTIMDAGRVATAVSYPTAETSTFNNYVGFARTLKQVLNIVYASPTGAPGGFLPNGLNGTIS